MNLKDTRILVVEDHEVQRRALLQILKNLGAELLTIAEDGTEALKTIREADQPFDIMITDLFMPGMDGIELVRHLGASATGISIILASSLEPQVLASVASMAQAYKVNLLGVMSKPPSAAILGPLLAQYLDPKPPQGSKQVNNFTFAEVAAALLHDEFEALYEPRVDLATLKVKAMQVVLRWRHPDRGLLTGKTFEAAIAAFGLSDELVWVTLRKSCAQWAVWARAGLDLKICVNLNVNSLADPNLITTLTRIVQEQGADASKIVLGIGEKAVDVTSPRSLENLVRLRVNGFGLAIDEFGTGAMSAEQLSQIAFNELKISRNFVASGVSTPVRAGLAVALDTASQLHLLAVADGITTVDDWNLLQEWGCHLGQGGLISKPLEGHSVSAWVKQWPQPAKRGVWAPSPLV